jgi:hypothetical protein
MSHSIATQVSSPRYDEIVRIPTTFTTVLLNREGLMSGPLCAQTPPAGKVLSEDNYESPEWAVLIKL